MMMTMEYFQLIFECEIAGISRANKWRSLALLNPKVPMVGVIDDDVVSRIFIGWPWSGGHWSTKKACFENRPTL
jgi:hypothetical protein